MRIDVGSEPPSMPQSQTELEEFFDLALDLMAIAGFDGSIRRVNAAYERTLGYSVRELLSRPLLETVYPEDVPWVRDGFGELVDGDRDGVIGFEHRVICGDGSVRWLQWNTRTVPERGVVFAVGRDVTDRRRADAELGEAHRIVEASPALLTDALDHAQRATDELREPAHGILPAVLTQGGLRSGVDALASRMPVPVKTSVSVGRLPAAVEATAYFLVSKALTNVAKHARAGHAEVTARIEDGTLAPPIAQVEGLDHRPARRSGLRPR